MRYRNFGGIIPKLKPQTHDVAFAQVAHNLDLYSGELRPLRAPGLERAVVDVFGNVMTATAQTVYRAGEMLVGFPEHTWVIPDTVGALEHERFLYVANGKLMWQLADRVAGQQPPIEVGVQPPCDAPTANMLVGAGCAAETIALQCVSATTGEENCLAPPSILTSYVYTYVKYYSPCQGRMEESQPSPPLCIDVVSGDAPLLSAPPLPAGVDAVRWYREIAGAEGSVYLFAGETTTPAFLDNLCPLALGEPLNTSLGLPPPACVDGVARVGDNMTVLWHGRQLYVSEPHQPHLYNVDRDTFDIPFDIVAVRGLEDRVEDSFTYSAHVLTTGKPYRMAGTLPENLEIRETQDWHPCVSVRSVCDMRGGTGYASPYGFVRFSGTACEVLTDNYMTENEWQQTMPHDVRAAWWAGRVWMCWAYKDGYNMVVEEAGGARPKMLLTHSVRADALNATADGRLWVAQSGTTGAMQWGEGAPLMYTWHGLEEVQSGLWKPSAIKVVSDFMRRRYNHEELYATYHVWASSQPEPTAEAFVQQHPEWRHMLAQLRECPTITVQVLRDAHMVYRRSINDSRPFRIPRSVRAIEWSVKVQGYTPVREIHIQSSIADLNQEGGMA
jgi:hypothetical protein